MMKYGQYLYITSNDWWTKYEKVLLPVDGSMIIIMIVLILLPITLSTL